MTTLLTRRLASTRSVVRGRRRDEGRAIVEFIFLGMLLLLPLVYLVLTAARLQAASFSA